MRGNYGRAALALLAAMSLGGAPLPRAAKTAAGTLPPGELSAMAREVEDASRMAAVGPGARGPLVVRAQILLDRARFSPGEIDGAYGDDLAVAIRGYRSAHGLEPGAAIDQKMWKLLETDSRPLLTAYVITAADLKGPFQPVPKGAKEQAQMKWMGYESPQEELGERFHAAPKLLAELNPGKTLQTAGERIVVPSVRRAVALPAARVVISKSRRTVTAYGAGGRLLAQYPATMGGVHDPLPIGHWTIVSVVHDPWFNWDPVHFWNANPNEAAEKLPPGPNNPVGVVWMGLSVEHYGIHGTDDPGHVHHDESYGCIRLTNWDADDLSHMVRRGTPVIGEE